METQSHQQASRGVQYASARPSGGRIASDALRQSHDLADDFNGLEENFTRFDLLNLVKRVGGHAEFTPREIALLEYYIGFTRDMDWEQGTPICYQSLSRTALDLGVSERQIQHLENSLFKKGCITWRDSGNHKRYGLREPTGELAFAFGVDLSPLAYLREELEEMLEIKLKHQQQWMERKRQISWYRSQIRSHIAELELLPDGQLPITEFWESYTEIAKQIRSHLSIDMLDVMLERHKALYERVLNALERSKPSSEEGGEAGDNLPKTSNTSPRDEVNFTHKEDTNNSKLNKFKSSQGSLLADDASSPNLSSPNHKEADVQVQTLSGKDLILGTGLQHVTKQQIIAASSERFREHLMKPGQAIEWPDLVEAAFQVRKQLGISHQTWGDACQLLTRNGAAVCVALIDAGLDREDNPVRKPAAYFKAMLKRAGQGHLNLQKSVFGQIRTQ